MEIAIFRANYVKGGQFLTLQPFCIQTVAIFMHGGPSD